MKKITYIIIISLFFANQLKAQHKYYFPISTNNTGLDTFSVQWYSRELKDMKEPVLFKSKSKNEVYRFTWLRSFNHPIAIRIEKNGNGCFIYWKQGDHNTDHPKLLIDKQKTITKTVWDEFMQQLKKIDFWKMNTREKSDGADGSEWLLEGKTPNNYHVVDRWTPNSSALYYKCCDYLISLTDIKIAPNKKF